MNECDKRRRKHGRKGILMATAMLALLMAGGYAGWGRYLQAKGPYADPDGVELPPVPDDKRSSSGYLVGPDGQKLSAFMTALEPIYADGAEATSCAAAVAVLDQMATPDQVFGIASGFPDGTTSEIAVRHVVAGTRFLGQCLEYGSLPSPDELRFTAKVLSRRLEQLR